MPNIGEVLKSEISRLSKKVARQHTRPVHSATSANRKQLTALKKQMQKLEREVAALRRAVNKGTARPEPEADTKHRFTAKGLRSLRSKLGLSAEEFGRLIQVSPQTVYNWENKKTSPRSAQIPAIAGLRGIGKREARIRLDAIAS